MGKKQYPFDERSMIPPPQKKNKCNQIALEDRPGNRPEAVGGADRMPLGFGLDRAGALERRGAWAPQWVLVGLPLCHPQPDHLERSGTKEKKASEKLVVAL